MNLNNTKIGDKVIIKEVNTNSSIKRRLLDIGLTPGTIVENVLINPGGNLSAYKIRGALIAIREEDTSNIVVQGAINE